MCGDKRQDEGLEWKPCTWSEVFARKPRQAPGMGCSLHFAGWLGLGDVCVFSTHCTLPPTQDEGVTSDSFFFLLEVVSAFVVCRKGPKGIDCPAALILMGLKELFRGT